MEDEFIDEERIPLLERDENNDDSVYEDSQAETSFFQEDEQQQELDVEINALERGFNVLISPEERHRFRMSSGYLQVEKSPGEFVNITKSNGEFLAESTMRSRLGASLARELLGIETPSSVRSRSRVLIQEIPTELEMDDLSPEKLEEVISRSDERNEYKHRLGHARISRHRQGANEDQRRTGKQRGKIDGN